MDLFTAFCEKYLFLEQDPLSNTESPFWHLSYLQSSYLDGDFASPYLRFQIWLLQNVIATLRENKKPL